MLQIMTRSRSLKALGLSSFFDAIRENMVVDRYYCFLMKDFGGADVLGVFEMRQ